MSSSGSTPTDARPPALDGGWGWVIVVSGFLALLLGYGSPQSVGVLYPEWLATFGEGKAMTAWVGSVVTGVGLIVGECVIVSEETKRRKDNTLKICSPSSHRSDLQRLCGELRGSARHRFQQRHGGRGADAERLRSQRLLPHLLLWRCGR